jgi:hypothetical protein
MVWIQITYKLISPNLANDEGLDNHKGFNKRVDL